MEVHKVLEPKAPSVTTPSKIYHEAIQPFFAWIPVDRVQKTFERTTQFMPMSSSTYLRKQHQSANHVANMFFCGEADATDTIFSDTPAVDGGQTAAHIFSGRHSKLTSIHPLRDTGEEEIFGAFQDRVHWHGSLNEVIVDNSSFYHWFKFMKYVCNLYIQFWQSESYAENFV